MWQVSILSVKHLFSKQNVYNKFTIEYKGNQVYQTMGKLKSFM